MYVFKYNLCSNYKVIKIQLILIQLKCKINALLFHLVAQVLQK